MKYKTRLHIIILLSVSFAAVQWGTQGVRFGVAIAFVFGLGVFLGHRVTPRG